MLFSGEEKHLDKVMDFKAYEEFIESQDGYGKFCVICGISFQPNKRSQVTCLNPDCQKARQRDRMKARLDNMSDAEREEEREKHKKANREWSKKKFRSKQYERELIEQQKHWAKIEKFDKLIAEVGDHYGDYQKEQTLKMVTPIKLTLD